MMSHRILWWTRNEKQMRIQCSPRIPLSISSWGSEAVAIITKHERTKVTDKMLTNWLTSLFFRCSLQFVMIVDDRPVALDVGWSEFLFTRCEKIEEEVDILTVGFFLPSVVFCPESKLLFSLVRWIFMIKNRADFLMKQSVKKCNPDKDVRLRWLEWQLCHSQ